MKIALLTDGITPYVTGGMQRHSFYIAKFLAQKGVYVDLYHTQGNNQYDIHKLNVFTEEEKKHIRSFVIDFPKLDSFPGHYIRESYEYSRRIFEVLKNNLTIDFIYAKGFTAWHLLKQKDQGLVLPPVGVNFHGYEMFQVQPNLKGYLQSRLLLQKPVKWINAKADYVFSYGGKITSIIENIGVPKYKIIEIPAGIEEQWLAKQMQPANTIRKFLFVGRFERRKGIIEINKALHTLLGKYKFEFHFVGPIPDDKKINHQSITYHGSITDTIQLQSIIDYCDVLVCPSYSEGMPNVIVEAMARGLAVIATDVGATNLLVSAHNGYLLDSPNEKLLQQALINVIELDSEKLKQLKTNSLQHIQQYFLWSTIADRLLTQLQKSL